MRNLNNILLSGILIAFCWLVPIIATGQGAAVYNINKYNGVSTNHVYSTLVDKLGYLWLATTDGVYRYNGYSLDKYDYNDGLPNTDVWDMYEDRQGRIWLMSIANGIGYIKNNVYHPATIKNDSIAGQIYPDTFVELDSLILFKLKNGFEWANTYGIIRNDTVELRRLNINTFTHYLHIMPREIAIVSSTEGLVRYYPIDALVKGHKLTRARRTIRPVVTITKYVESTITREHKNLVYFSATKTDSVVFFDYDKNVVNSINFNRQTCGLIQHVHIYKDNFLVLTDRNAYSINMSQQLTDTFAFDKLYNTSSTKNYAAVFFMPDKFWGNSLSTSNEGVYISYNINNAFKLVHTSLAGYRYVSPVNDSTAYWWNERENSLVEIANGKIINSEQIKRRMTLKTIIPFNEKVSLFVSFPYLVWHGNNVMTTLFNTDTLVYNNISYNINDQGLSHFLGDCNNGIVVDTTNFIFLGTVRGTSHVTTNYSERKIHVNTIDRERYGGVLYYPRGDYYIVYSAHKILLYNAASKKKAIIPSKLLKSLDIHSIEKIVTDKYGNLVVKTYDKLLLFNPITGRFSTLFHNYNFQNAFISLSGNTLSLAGNFGVLQGNTTANGTVTNIRNYPNTKTLFYKYIYDVQFSKNSVLLKTDNGVYMLHTGSANGPASEPYRFIINNAGTVHNINADDTLYVNQTTGALGTDVIKPTGTGQLNIEYSLNNGNYSNTGYQLILPALKPGSYNTISLIASDDSWRSKPLKFTIYIQPKWWQTQTAKRVIFVSSLLAFIGFVYLVIVMTRRIVNRSNERRNQRRELELKSIYSQINPHFIFNSLSTAQYFVKKNKNKEAFEHINQFSDLLRAYIKSSRAKYITIAEEIENLENYLQLQLTRFEEKFEYDINVDRSLDAEKVKIPSLLLQPLVENALNHGIFHSDKKGRLNISFSIDEQDKDTLVCIVDDDGIGRQKAKELRGKIIRKADSYGMILIKELIDTFNKYEKINIEIEYIDKQLPLTGTTVVIRIKNFAHAQ